jgi:hypothetical protein
MAGVWRGIAGSASSGSAVAFRNDLAYSPPMPDDLATHRAGKHAPVRGKHRWAWSHAVALITSLAAGAAGAVTLLDSWQKVLVALGLREDQAFVLAEQSAKGDAVREITHMIAAREFWVVRYAGDVDAGFPQEDQDEAWKGYNATVIGWNENYMVYNRLIRRYFGPDADQQLRDVAALMRELNGCLNQIRYRAIYEADNSATCHVNGQDGGTEPQNFQVVMTAVGVLDRKFATFLDTISK